MGGHHLQLLADSGSIMRAMIADIDENGFEQFEQAAAAAAE